MQKFLDFDPSEIEEDVYTRLPENIKEKLADARIIRAIDEIRHRKAKNILEDEDVNILNF